MAAMKFAEFVQECRDDVDRFRDYWNEERRKNPQLYPLELQPGDWFDQFLAFLALEGKEGGL